MLCLLNYFRLITNFKNLFIPFNLGLILSITSNCSLFNFNANLTGVPISS